MVSLYHTHMVKIHASHFQLHSLPKKSWKVSPFVFIFSWKSNENYFFLYIFYNKTKYKKIIFFSVFFFSFLATKHKLKVVQSLIWAVFALQFFMKIKLLPTAAGIHYIQCMGWFSLFSKIKGEISKINPILEIGKTTPWFQN